MLVNALSYGTIIPLLYPYAAQFGITAAGMSWLFVSFSLAQFIATPIIGRLSDKYGRKPLLLLSLFGTSLSLMTFALAQTAMMLFIARILDGVTGGNVSVAQAIMADTTSENDRAKAFGILGAAFGFGFVFGPAIGGLLSQYSLAAPFWFAAGLALVGTILGVVLLKETNTTREPAKNMGALFDFKRLWQALFAPLTGVILAVSFITLVSQNAMIIGFQAFTVDVLQLDTVKIGVIFTLFGLLSVIMQGFGIKFLLQRVPSKRKLIKWSLMLAGILIILSSLAWGYVSFVVLILAYGVASSPIAPVVTGLLSERTKAEDQGGILGINQAYASLGQIIGPLMAGVLLTYSSRWAFVLTGVLLLIAIIPSWRIDAKPAQKFDL